MKDAISTFDMLKIGIGPSSSHTLGPWKAALAFIQEIDKLEFIGKVECHLYGSLALTGIGHGTDMAVLLGLSGEDPEIIALDKVSTIPADINSSGQIYLNRKHAIPFHPKDDIHFHFNATLTFHPNGLQFIAKSIEDEVIHEAIYFSIGGGFIVKENEEIIIRKEVPESNFETAKTLIELCDLHKMNIAGLAMKNELVWFSEAYIHERLDQLWNVMAQSIYRGCHTDGILPGGLEVIRRAAGINRKLLNNQIGHDYQHWLSLIYGQNRGFSDTLKWVSCFAMAVNEENANFGRIVTAPTNGAAGVIPAVLQYHICFSGYTVDQQEIRQFLLTAAAIGSLFKHQATISAAMGGCQAEIGVSSSMAAAALTECLGGSPRQALIAAEIAMEHHLGLTCDPIKGLVQVPCIERNCMGAVKAITAANIALETEPEKVKVSLDACIKTMWETAQDMHHKYKETSLGGLATNVIEC